jgi:hypothetical protein
MKKLVLFFLFVISGLAVFPQGNYNEKDFSTNSTLVGGHMERKGSNLKLDGRILSDTEVRDLVGEANYETYLDAKKQIAKAKTCQGIFIISSGATVALLLTGLVAKSPTIIYMGYFSSGFANVTLPLMCIYYGIGKGRMSWVADDYNEHSQSSVSYSLSPSIMRCNAQPEHASLGMGMTFSLNF